MCHHWKNSPCKSPKFEEKCYLCLHKRSVTSMRKSPIGQCFETDNGHFINGLERGGTRRICKAVKDNGLHLSPFSVNLSEVRLYRLRWMVTDNQWCEYVVWANNSLLAIIGKGVENQRLFSFYIIIKLNKTEAIMRESKAVTHWYYGHFHQSWHSDIDGILLKCWILWSSTK